MIVLVSILTSLIILISGNCPADAGGTSIKKERPDYLNILAHQIKRKWYPSPRWIDLPVSVAVIINCDGKLIDCSILKSSGNAEADTTALLAIRSAAPFKSIPAGSLDRDGHLSATVTFDWKNAPDSILVRVSGAKH